jgi:hypothetical protein
MIVLAEGRHPPQSDQDRSALYNTMIAHSGTIVTAERLDTPTNPDGQRLGDYLFGHKH